jgi:hypothetical protein
MARALIALITLDFLLFPPITQKDLKNIRARVIRALRTRAPVTMATEIDAFLFEVSSFHPARRHKSLFDLLGGIYA